MSIYGSVRQSKSRYQLAQVEVGKWFLPSQAQLTFYPTEHP